MLEMPHTPHPVEKIEELEHTAEVGESDTTPLILIGGVWIFAAVAVLVLLAVALLAYKLAT
jgi:hypothetical protein